jgi:hypothetical protein
MAYPPKINHAIAVLTGLGVSRVRAAPPIYRPLWECGVPMRPPLFRGFFGNFLIMLVVFGVLFSALSWATFMSGSSSSFFLIMYGGLTVFSALVCAADFHRTARTLNLPAWSEIHEDIAARFD